MNASRFPVSFAALLLPVIACGSNAGSGTATSGSASATKSGEGKETAAPSSSGATATDEGPLALEGASLVMPPGYVALDDATHDQLQSAAAAAAPDGRVTVVGRKSAKGLQDGLVYFTRAELPASATNLHGTVQDRLTDAAGQLEIGATIAGMQVTHYDRKVSSSWADARLGATLQSTSGSIKIGVAVRIFLDDQKRLVTVSLACMESAKADGCASLLDQTKFDSGKSLAAGEVLGPPGEELDLGGFRTGESEEEFFAACKKRGLAKVDLGPPPADAATRKEGSPAECKGADPSFPWGPLTSVTGSFFQGKAMLFTFDTDAAPKDVDDRLDKVMSKSTLRQPGGLRFPKPAAQGFELLAIGVVETPSKPGKGSLLVWSRAAWDTVHPIQP